MMEEVDKKSLKDYDNERMILFIVKISKNIY